MRVDQPLRLVRFGNRSAGPEKRGSGSPSSERAWGPHPHAVSQACAAFYRQSVGLLRIVSEAHEPKRLGVAE
jgi:hypothetical protein